MSARYDCMQAQERTAGVAAAAAALRGGDLAVIPTDTVYGVAADAFSPAAVNGLLAAKGRGRQMPPPVLVGSVRAAAALVEAIDASGKDLIEEFWPGALTLIFRANRSLAWDLGDTKGTVAVRMPLNDIALDVLRETGPLAVSSANRSGRPPATSADDAQAQLGDAVAVYLDGGPCRADVPSTIVDLTGPIPRLLRAGVITVDRLRTVVTLIAPEDEPAEPSEPSEPAEPSGGAQATPDGASPDGPSPDGASPDGPSPDSPSPGSARDRAGGEGGE